MKLSSLHILLTYQCTFECDHCFVWGSPWQTGTLSLDQVENILHQAGQAGVEWIYYEGGEPFLFYSVLLRAVELAKDMGFHVGVVTNGYWATSVKDALEYLKPLKMIDDLSVSSDLYHYNEEMSRQAANVVDAAGTLRIPVGTIMVGQPEESSNKSHGQLEGGSPVSVMYRGRAAVKLIHRVSKHSWRSFVDCPHEDLDQPDRIHLDPLGNLHICQGIVIGNIFDCSLEQILASYDIRSHPICRLLKQGGPAALVTEYKLPHKSRYADACHLCYEARMALRPRFPEILKPGQVYGEL